MSAMPSLRAIPVIAAVFLGVHAAVAYALSGGISVDEVLAGQGDPPFTEQQLALASAVSAVTVPLFIFDAAGHPDGLCSATVVHPRVVLTAGHCVVHDGEVMRRFVVLFGGGSSTPARRQGIDVVVHPEYLRVEQGGSSRRRAASKGKGLSERETEALTNDLALVLMHRPIPETHDVVAMVPPGFRDELGIRKVIAGYGQVGATVAITKLALRFADLRGNTRDLSGAVGGGGEIVMEARRQNGAKVNVCSRDSGGPIFVLDRSAAGLRQIAVASAGDLHCREHAIYAPIDRQRATLRRMFDSLMQGEQGAEQNPF